MEPNGNEIGIFPESLTNNEINKVVYKTT